MFDLTAIALNLPVFFLVLCRAGGIFIAAPILSNDTIPARIKVMLSVLLALVMYPFATQFSGPLPGSVLALVPMVLKELGMGLIMGFAASLVFAAVQSAGALAAQQIGLTLSEIASPGFADEEADQISGFFGIIGLLLFLAVDGHHWFVEAVAASFRSVPLGEMPIRPQLASAITNRFTFLFVYAIRIAAPLMAIMFLVNIAIAVMAKSVPQMNILMVGYPVKVCIGVAAMLLTFPLMWPVLRQAFSRLQGDMLYFSRLL
jgi:flagellar biosynthetic protein FliR